MKKYYIPLLVVVLSLIVYSKFIENNDRLSPPDNSYSVINVYPHDTGAFTQGLVYKNGFLYESTGLYGRSSLRKVDPATGQIVKRVDIPKKYFAEGIAILNNRIYQLTWKSGTGFVYDLSSFKLLNTFSYNSEGWGITTDGKNLIISDGTSRLYFMDPSTFRIFRSINVTYNNSPLKNINELEYINDLIYANIWQTNYIAEIDPETGKTVNILDLENILKKNLIQDNVKVPNGIAYNYKTQTLYITGKLWPNLFEIEHSSY